MISPRKVTYANDNDIFNVGHPKVTNGRESQKENYRSELFEQMREKDRKKAEEKRKQELYDLKLEREMQNYDPFGKGKFRSIISGHTNTFGVVLLLNTWS